MPQKELPKSSNTQKLTIIKKRPELPQKLFGEAILKDKIKHDSGFGNSSKETDDFKISRPEIGMKLQKKGISDKERALKTFDVGQKITLKSFEINSCRPSRPTNRLFRNQTISGFFVGAPLAYNQGTNKELKTCKVQPICIRSTSDSAPKKSKALNKSYSVAFDYVDEQQQDSARFLVPTKHAKLQRSESDVGSKLRFFTLRRPRTINCAEDFQDIAGTEENVSPLPMKVGHGRGGGNKAEDDIDRAISLMANSDFHENRFRYENKMSANSSKYLKPNSVLLKQNSVDLSSDDEFVNIKKTKAFVSTSLDKGIFHRSKTYDTLFDSSSPSNHHCEAEDNFEGHYDPMPNLQRSVHSFRIAPPDTRQSKPSSSCSPYSLKNATVTNQKASKFPKISKKKSAKMRSSLVKNVPSILSGLKKSLPLQLSSQTTGDSVLSMEKETKKLRLSPSLLLQTPTKLSGKCQGKTEKLSLSSRPISKGDDELQVFTSSSSSSSSKESRDNRPEVSDNSPLTGAQKTNRRREGRPSITPSLETCLSNVTEFSSHSNDVSDKRDLILKEFLISEKQYVETLRMLVEKYMLPLKTQDIVESGCVEEIFYKIQEIYVHHATLITFLAKALNRWNDASTVGDVIFKNFSKETVIESYVSFVEHFPRAEKALEELLLKSSFQKFIEQCEKETGVKLPLKAQLVKPAQRIPRYELLLKRLLENTPLTHPDHPLLRQAESAIHDLALRINRVDKDGEQEEGQDATLKKLELLLITDLVIPGRHYVRNDMVTIHQSAKDQQCCLWLFSDLLVFSVVKRKNSAISRKATLLLRSVSGNDFVENVKHKSWLKVPLSGIDIWHSTLSENIIEKTKAKQQLKNDHQTLNQIVDLTGRLKCSHFSMDEAVEDVAIEIGRKLKEIDNSCIPPDREHHLILHFSVPQEGLQNLCLTFSSAEKQMSWEVIFLYYKNK